MICLAASKLTSFSCKLYHSLRIHHFVEFTGGWLAWKFWCQLSDENPSSPGHLPPPHSTAHFYPTLIPKTRWCFHRTLFLTCTPSLVPRPFFARVAKNGLGTRLMPGMRGQGTGTGTG